MQVFNNNADIASTSFAYPAIPGGLGVYYWDGTGWVATRNSGGDFDWLRSSDNGSPSSSADIANDIYHGGDGNQEVTIRTRETDPDKFAKMTVSAGYDQTCQLLVT